MSHDFSHRKPAPPTRLLLVAASLGALLVACKGNTPQQARQVGPQLVRVQIAHPEPHEKVVELTGTLSGQEEVTVSAEVDGRVERVAADLGDTVEAGASLVRLGTAELRFHLEQAESEYQQTLARLGIDPDTLDQFKPESQAEVRRTLADLEEARRNRSRGEELVRRRLLAQGELDTLRTREQVAEAAYQRALEEVRSTLALAKGRRAALRLAQKKLADANVRSPIRGAVARRLVSPGEFVRAGQAVAVVVMTDPLKLQGEVPERHAGQVRTGLKVELAVASHPGRVFEAELSRIGPLVSESSRTFPIEATVPNSDGALRPGLFADARILLGVEEEVFPIPETALSSIAGVHKVFVERDGKAVERPVEIVGKRGSDALLRGIKAGDRVILTAIARLYDGAEVRVDEVEPPEEILPVDAAEAPGGEPANDDDTDGAPTGEGQR